jgi:hypothetical protein
MSFRRTWWVFAVVPFLSVPSPLAAATAKDPLANVTAGGTRIDWLPMGSYECLQLTVTGPDVTVERKFPAGESPSFELSSLPADGSYNWQLTRSDESCAPRSKPQAAAPDLEALALAAPKHDPEDSNGRSAALRGRPQKSPEGPYLQSGTFQVEKGTIVVPRNVQEKRAK